LRIRLPNNWSPRPYQRPAWDYLENGGKHCELIWHRRSGKDEVGLHRTAVAAFERVATYWYMLPLATQARKAIWEAVNPHTGRRRIDEVFPLELRSSTQQQEMFIKLKNGSSWQVVGSDNFNAMVGSPPAGIVYSEWALSNPSARAYLRPILAENGGWQIFNTTPRGKNHAHRTFVAAKNDPRAFAQLLSAKETGIFTNEQLEEELDAYQNDFGMDAGNALFEQEYLCSFEAAILGAFYAREMQQCRNDERITEVPHDVDAKVFTAWDIGYTDDTSIWWFQVIQGEIHVLECYTASGMDIPHYVDVILSKKEYVYDKHYLPHDARAKTLASGGKSVIEQLGKYLGVDRLAIVPEIGVQDGIQAARSNFFRLWFDDYKCAEGLDALSQYQREYDDTKKMFRDKPRHDWTSHLSDAFRMMMVAFKTEFKAAKPVEKKIRLVQDLSLEELWEINKINRTERI